MLRKQHGDRKNPGYTPPALSLQQPDLGVLRKAQRGDERAFAIIVRAYETPVFNYVLRLVGDRALAEDLTQETFLKALRGLGGYRPELPFRAWLYRIATNSAISALRRRGPVMLSLDVESASVFDVYDELLVPLCFQAYADYLATRLAGVDDGAVRCAHPTSRRPSGRVSRSRPGFVRSSSTSA